MRIVFFGTPDFAVASLDRIVRDGFNVVAVVTSPDKPAGRGMKVQFSPVKSAAIRLQIPLLQPANLKSAEFLQELREYKADLQIVIAFRMLPEVVWNMPKLGTFNLHASLLPKYRGAAPIQRAIMNHETETGVTTFFLKHEIDTGDLLLQKKVAISAEMTGGELHDMLMISGAELVSETLKGIVSNSLQPLPQASDENLPTAPKIYQTDTQIIWSKSGLEIYDLIRAMNPYPGAFFKIQDYIIKVYTVIFDKINHQIQPGTAVSDGKNYWKISCNDGWIYLIEVQPQGKKKLNIKDFLNGDKAGLCQVSPLI